MTKAKPPELGRGYKILFSAIIIVIACLGGYWINDRAAENEKWESESAGYADIQMREIDTQIIGLEIDLERAETIGQAESIKREIAKLEERKSSYGNR